MRFSLIFSCLPFLLFFGCDSKDSLPKDAPPVVDSAVVASAPTSSVQTLPTRILFQEPVEPHIFELSSEALSVWRDFRYQRPTLVILADAPYLEPLLATRKDEVVKLILSGSVNELRRRADYDQADPAVLAPQSVRAALLTGIFSQVVWLLPDDRPYAEFSWAVVEQQLREAALLQPEQHLRLLPLMGVAEMQIEGIPVSLVHPDAWSKYQLAGPIVLHFDLSYFKAIYRSEVRLPAYQLLNTLAQVLRQSRLNVLAVTLSYGTSDRNVALDGRFTLPVMAELMRQPQLLDGERPKAWKLRSRALYMRNMFMETEVTRIYDELLLVQPNDPAALYDVAQRRFYHRKFADGLALLGRAVERDPGYAQAYLQLAERAEAASDLPNARILVDKAALALPTNPMVTLRRIDLYLRLGEKDEAERLISTLEALSWSPEYHAEIPAILEGMRKALNR